MRHTLAPALVFVGVLLSAGLTTGHAEQQDPYDMTQTADEEASAEREATRAAQDRQDDEDHDEYLEEASRINAAERADAWADTHLVAEKAAAVYWRDAYVEYGEDGDPVGTLRAADGRVIRYDCDVNYDRPQSGGCVPADRDYDCAELRSWGIVNIPVRTPVSSVNNPDTLVPHTDQRNINPPLRGDWMLLDDDHDGLGCELWTLTAPRSSLPTGVASHWRDPSPLLDELPSDLPACLRFLVDEHLDYAAMTQRFPGVPDAPARLGALGWKTAVHRQFSCDPLPNTGLSWLDMSVHLFRDTASAAEAVPFFAHARTVGTQLVPVPAITLGDSTAAIAGPSENGTEYTLYLSTGPLVFRMSGIAADGAPQADVEKLMTGLLGNVMELKDTTNIPYLTVDPATGRGVAIYPDGTVVPNTPTAPSETIAPLATGTGAGAATPPNCDPSYPDVCIAPVEEVGDLDCEDVWLFNFRVIGTDPHRLDGPYDGSNPSEPDGIGCEWIYGGSDNP